VWSIDERSGKNHSDVRFAIGVYKKLEKIKLNTLGTRKLNLNGKKLVKLVW